MVSFDRLGSGYGFLLIIIIDSLGLAARSWNNTMRSNKTTIGLMSNVSNSARLHIVHNPDLDYYSEKVVIIKIQTVRHK